MSTEGAVDLGATQVITWTYGGELPGKEIRVQRGDVLKVDLSNRLKVPTTIHWHGIALRNDMDGVPNLTQSEIPAGGRFTYEFTVPDAGTYWFHPHVGTQLDTGLYAPLIVEDPEDGGDYDTELVVVLDDWLDGLGRSPADVLADLRTNGMTMEHTGMPGMSMPQSDLLGGDVGDVVYPHMLANGRTANAPHTFATKPGQRVRLRLINAGSDTAFRVGVPDVRMTVTHTDGFPVVPVEAETVLLGMGERIDATITVPSSTTALLAVAEGRGAYAQVIIQSGRPVDPTTSDAAATQLTTLPALTVRDIEAAESVRLPDKAPDITHTLTLEGPGDKYDWTINGRTYDPNDGLPIQPGQRVRLRLENSSEMFHPMHLHGHTFQVVDKGRPGARKDTVIVLPDQTLEVDFDADNPGQWLTHCHNVYHGETGMMTVMSYEA
ncbi:multicopper oxidase family protein [Actinophytocola sp.]|uniref:multicopper oxidase family protein n=1 Tax=Actinophytocola sp. TaxID=1872138 RepID=UPI002ED5210B